jgi:hypothetical protein
MKYWSKLLIWLPPFILFIQSSCKKEKLGSEAATRANTFASKVTGEIYTPSGSDASSGWSPVEHSVM